MKRTTRNLLIGLGVIVGVPLLAMVLLAIAVPLIDWNRARPWLADHVGSALGRDVMIDGDLRVRWRMDKQHRVHPWLPRLHVDVANISVSDAQPDAKQRFARSASVEFDLLPWALFAHEIAVGSVHATQPVVHLRRDASGANNWTFQSSPDSSPWRFRVGRVAFDAGTVDIDDAMRKLHAHIVVQPLPHAQDFASAQSEAELAAQAHAASEVGARHATDVVAHARERAQPRTGTRQAYVFAWKANGDLAGRTLTGSGKIGNVLGIHQDEEPWPLQADITHGSTHLSLVGTLRNPAQVSALDLRLWLSGASLADLYPLLHITLPDTAQFVTDGHLVGELHANGNTLHYENFTGRVGQSDLSGSINYDGRRARALLSGNVASNLLQFADLGTLVGASGEKAREKPAGKELPVQRFRTERWNTMDADVVFSGKRLARDHDAQLPISDIQTRIALDNGVLSLKPLRFAIAGGSADAQLRLDSNATPLGGTFTAGAHHLKLTQILPSFATTRASVGEINGDVALTMRGKSVAELLAHSSGEVKLLVDSGTVSKSALEEANLNLVNILLAKLFGDQRARINCAAADLDANDGVLKPKLFVFDTDTATIRVDGTVDLGNEKIDLVLHPESKGPRVLSLRAPLHVTGTFERADVSIDKRALFARGGSAVALGALAPIAALAPLVTTGGRDNDTCGPVLARMRTRASTSQQ